MSLELEVPRWYPLTDLADRWCVSVMTVRHWLYDARACGKGPSDEQYDTRRIGRAGRKRMLLRADYANFLHSHARGRRLVRASIRVSRKRALGA